ncbi:MAG: DJ-1/PfpI family protein [Rhodospirillales bacterium]|nr:DJ-1/PfpI family protein [Rhodospirillales bacterium]
MSDPITVVFPLYDRMTQLDFTGPWQVLRRLPGAEVLAASLTGAPVEADGLVFDGLTALTAIPRCDVLCLPGGYGMIEVMANDAFLAEIRRLAEGAQAITSVCTGSLILAAAGLLVGRRAASHWAWRDHLALFGAIPDAGRVVHDGRFVTGGGVTAGIDFALTLAADLAGPAHAQAIQLGLEYAPAPPFEAGRPELAPPAVLAQVQAANAAANRERVAAVERIGAAFRARLEAA